jgi:hypothetical protein
MAPKSPLPLSILAPAVASLGAYANAKYGIWSDLAFISRFIGVARSMTKIENADRVNIFYLFESLAKDPKSANRTFILLPPDSANAQPG